MLSCTTRAHTISPKQAEELIIPYQVDGLYVKGFTADVFKGNKRIKKITIQSNIRIIYDGSFNGCTKLTGIYLEHSDPASVSVGFGLLNGTDTKIYVATEHLSKFKNNYFWGNYAAFMQGY